MSRLGGHTVTVVRPAGKDRFGDPLSGVIETDVAGCYVQPRTSTEQTDQRDTVITGLIVFMPPTADVLATDKVRWLGGLYQVDGDPARWADVHARSHHIQVALRRVEG
ncbi:MAG: hypothetical protein JWO67_7188 [Streptosporangiaceae bacterium]|nr:hypothetical protein [Streptosporangiaceae bacterium]